MDGDNGLRGSTQEPGHVATTTSVESHFKRRKLRKGTHSCWECKRRKIKCTLMAASDVICVGCRRRGTPCIDQTISEGEIVLELKNPMVRVEALINQLVSTVRKGTEDKHLHTNPSITPPDSITHSPQHNETSEHESTLIDNTKDKLSPSSVPIPLPTLRRLSSSTSVTSKYASISRTLHAAFPSREDLARLRKAGSNTTLYCYLVNMRPDYKGISGNQPESLAAKVLHANMHPVLLAKQMLFFALVIQQLSGPSIDALSEDSQAIMQRLADNSINLVTTNEELHGTAESLECIVLEGVYHLAGGNLRRSWLSFRRALTVSQLMGINRPQNPPVQSVEPNHKINAEFMWFRIVYMDRWLSLSLGFPQGSADISMGSTSTAFEEDTPMGQLERTHAVVMSRILELRNNSFILQDLAVVREIDGQLLKAAKHIPSKSWLPPAFIGLKPDSKEQFLETQRFKNQVVHYSLICQLHLPFLLHPNWGRQCKYSKMACINASREILMRCLHYSTALPFGGCSRFFAVPAAITLLLAFLDCHRHDEEIHILGHQRLSDRGMIEQILNSLDSSGRDQKYEPQLIDEGPGKRCANDVLQWLLDAEEEAAEGQSVTQLQKESQNDDQLQIRIPHFGIIKITRDGTLTKESAPVSETDQEGRHDQTSRLEASRVGMQTNLWESSLDQVEDGTGQFSLQSNSTAPTARYPQEAFAGYATTSLDVQHVYQHPTNPGLTAGVDEWGYQGVENAYFDNLLVGLDGSAGSEWLPDWRDANSNGS